MGKCLEPTQLLTVAKKLPEMDTRQRNMKSAENQLTIMLLLVTMLFLILFFPAYIRFIYSTFVGRETPSKYRHISAYVRSYT